MMLYGGTRIVKTMVQLFNIVGSMHVVQWGGGQTRNGGIEMEKELNMCSMRDLISTATATPRSTLQGQCI